MTQSDTSRYIEPAVLLVGVGGIGSPAAIALAASGVKRLGLLDPDVVETVNLHRQILYNESDIQKPKVEVAARVLHEKHPELQVEAIAETFPNQGWGELVARYDCVIDGLDRLEKKYLLNDACVKAGKPFVHAGVLGLGGQVLAVRPRVTACLRCLIPEMPSPDALPTSLTAGILGPVAHWIGYWEAWEALELLNSRTVPLLWSMNAWKREIRSVEPIRNPKCPACGNRNAP